MRKRWKKLIFRAEDMGEGSGDNTIEDVSRAYLRRLYNVDQCGSIDELKVETWVRWLSD